MQCVNLLGQPLIASDFGRQVAKLQFRIAIINSYTALGIPVTEVLEYVRPENGEYRLSAYL